MERGSLHPQPEPAHASLALGDPSRSDYDPFVEAFAIQAILAPYGPFVPSGLPIVSRTIAVRGDQTLEQLHEALRLAFGWADPHMYAFWMGGKWWDRDTTCYQTPFELDPDDDRIRSGRIPISRVGLRKGTRMAYLFDYGDEWRLRLKVVDRWRIDGGESYPMLVDAEGVPPLQYAPLDEDDEAGAEDQ